MCFVTKSFLVLPALPIMQDPHKSEDFGFFLDRRWSAEVASDLARAASGLAVAAGGLRGPQVACGGRR